MPPLSVAYVRASLVYLALGFTLGAILLSNKALDFYPAAWKLLPVHIEMLMMGWFVQLAAGVAFWILPRLSGTAPRGSLFLVWSAFWLINLGISLVIAEAIFSLPVLLLLGRLAELAGVMVFAIASWKRLKGFTRN